MGFRFRKSIKLLPGIRLNLSRSGVGGFFGRPATTIHIFERSTVGILGAGLIYNEGLSGPNTVTVQTRAPAPEHEPTQEAANSGGSLAPLLLLVLVVLLAGLLIFRLVAS